MAWRSALAAAMLVFAAPAHAQSGVGGAWAGAGLQTTALGQTETWQIRVTFDASGNARVDYPSLQCGGAWTRLGGGSEIVRYRERITYGNCIDDATVAIRPQDGKLFMSWTVAGEASFIAAAAVLFTAAPIA